MQIVETKHGHESPLVTEWLSMTLLAFPLHHRLPATPSAGSPTG